VERSESRLRAERSHFPGVLRPGKALEPKTMYCRHAIQISRRMRAALEYSMAIVSALASSYLILRLGL